MPIIKFTPAQLQAGKLLDAGWFGMEIRKVSDWKESKAGGSLNLIVTFLIEKTEGKEIEINFNSKMIHTLTPLMSACLGKVVTPEDEINTDDLTGKKVDGYVTTKTYEGRLLNDITNFAPYGKAVGGPNF